MIRKLVFFTVVFTSSMISQFAIAEDSKSGSQQDVIVEDKVDAREHIAGLDWTHTKPWSDIRSSWFSNDLLWPFYEEVKAQPFSLDNADFKALIKGISYLSWKSPQVHFTGEFIASLKNDKSLTDEQIEGIFKSISLEPSALSNSYLNDLPRKCI